VNIETLGLSHVSIKLLRAVMSSMNEVDRLNMAKMLVGNNKQTIEEFVELMELAE